MKTILLILSSVLIVVLASCDSQTHSGEGFRNDPGPVLFISNVTGVRHLYSMNPDGSDVRHLTRSDNFQVIDAVWSPDYTWMVQKGGGVEDGHNTQARILYVTDVRGVSRFECHNVVGSSEDERLILSVGFPTFVTGGGSIIFRNSILHMADCSFTTWYIPIPGSYRTTITDTSNDGERLLGHTDLRERDQATGEQIIHVRASFWTVDGDSLYSLGELGEKYLFPVWSTGEDAIAFGLRRGEQQWLYRMANDGSNMLQLTGDEYNDIAPVAWSLDNTKILAKGRKQQTLRWSILMVDANGGGVTDLTPFPDASSYPTSWRTN